MRGRVLVAGLIVLPCLAGLAFIDPGAIAQEVVEQYRWRMAMDPTVLTVEQEKAKAAKPGSDFKECANGCPVMIVIPAGKFIMGSPENELDRNASEGPQHEVTVAKPFAVSKFEVTFEEWDACVAAAACPSHRPLGTPGDACDQRELARRQAVFRLALAVDWQGVPASDRGRMGYTRRPTWRDSRRRDCVIRCEGLEADDVRLVQSTYRERACPRGRPRQAPSQRSVRHSRPSGS